MIVSCGEALIDFLPMASAEGARGWRPFPGGSPFNIAVAIARLGVPAGFLSRLSRDLFGDQLMAAMQDNKVDTALVRRSDEPSTLAFVDAEPGQEPRYAFFAVGAADRSLAPTDLPASLPDGVACLHFGSNSLAHEPSASTLEGLMRRESGRRVLSLDPNIRPTLIADPVAYRRRFEGWIRHAGIVKLSRADLLWLYPGAQVDAVVDDWLQRGPALVVVTRGGDGALTRTRNVRAEIPGIAITVVDTIGAGDTFHGALLARLFRHRQLSRQRLGQLDQASLVAALDYANRAAAINCARPGMDPPYASELAD
jgi:fructokinase